MLLFSLSEMLLSVSVCSSNNVFLSHPQLTECIAGSAFLQLHVCVTCLVARENRAPPKAIV